MRQIYTREQVIRVIEELLQCPDQLIDAITNENTDWDAATLFSKIVEAPRQEDKDILMESYKTWLVRKQIKAEDVKPSHFWDFIFEKSVAATGGYFNEEKRLFITT